MATCLRRPQLEKSRGRDLNQETDPLEYKLYFKCFTSTFRTLAAQVRYYYYSYYYYYYYLLQHFEVTPYTVKT